ncbi:hypothetical protein TNCT_673811 [Trichonephila clavata]|uniref:Uncharacterized protein n=1 Tax=Trichonephila clavata TaxID=2740835 RepID=A0A8X6FN32_TRICU|nr:hypothetical protein TNCT_673811 [Trichonephila clavata]
MIQPLLTTPFLSVHGPQVQIVVLKSYEGREDSEVCQICIVRQEKCLRRQTMPISQTVVSAMPKIKTLNERSPSLILFRELIWRSLIKDAI